MIRRFTKTDLEQVMEIERTSFAHPYDRDTILFYWYSSPDTFLVYTHKKRVIGYMIYLRDGHIISIAVDKKYRRRGIGTELIKEVIDKLKSKRMWVEVRTSNAVAQKFYKKLGFRYAGRLRSYYENGEDALVFVKDL